MQLTSNQLRAARALLGITQEELGERTKTATDTIKKFEAGHTEKLHGKTDRALIAYLSTRVEFTEREGVRFKPADVEIYEGPERFEEFYTFLYDHLTAIGGDVCVSTTDENLFRKYRKRFDMHVKLMRSMVHSGKVTFRIIATESNFTSNWAQYRWQPRQSSDPVSFYAFGNCLALISFTHEPAPYVVLHKSGPFAEAYRNAFELAWANAKSPPEKEKK